MFFHPVLATQIFANSRYPDGYRPASRAYFQSQILPPVCFIIPNPAPQITLILRSRKTYWGPSRQSRKSRGLSLASRIPCLLSIRNLAPSLLYNPESQSAYHLYGNFGEKFPSNGTSIFIGTKNGNGIELHHLQNTG